MRASHTRPLAKRATRRAAAGRWSWLLALIALPAFAAGGSYATQGTGTFAQSLWWLDFTGFNTASTATQALTFTLPAGGGSLSLSAQVTAGMALVAEPAWSGGAFGHGAYNGITGAPIFYWLNQSGTGTATLSGIKVKDAAGNSRSFMFYAADGENTNSGESITYTSTANWNLTDNVTYYASFNGGAEVLSGLGTRSVVETPPTSNDNSFNGSVVIGTASPTQVASSFSGNDAALFALSLPPITLNVVVTGRISASDQFSASVAYTSPALAIKTVTSAGTGNASTGSVAVIGTNSISLSAAMAAGSFSVLSAYTGSISCTNSGPGAAAYGATNTVLPSGAGTSFTLTPQTGDSISCTLTLSPPPQTVSGSVYSDANHNGVLDAGESGTGVAGLYVKLAAASAGACSGPATVAAAVNASSGTYSLANVVAGSYCLILNRDNTLSDITPAVPAGWIGTQNATGIIQLTTVPSALPTPQNFGLYNGSSISGTVFGDTGGGSGTANNGLQDGSESGLSGLTVQSGGATTATATTASNGAYTLWIPASSTGTVSVAPTLPTGYLATGGSAGTSGGSYSRAGVTYTPSAGQLYTGVNFGLVPPNNLAPNGSQQGQPGTTVYYAHTFVAGSAGQVTFSMSGTATPAGAGWTQVLYQDSACTGTLTSADPQVSSALSVVAAQKLCLIVKVQIPATATAGAQSNLALSAALQYTNANPALASTVTAADVTTVGAPGALSLSKLVSDLTQGTSSATALSAKPGDTLQYSLTATNNGSQPLSTLAIYDSTPFFTAFASTACPATLPTGLSGCAIKTQPAVGASGALQWTFSGSLASGAAVVVTYQVTVVQ
jgi:prealbumin domain-containing protein